MTLNKWVAEIKELPTGQLKELEIAFKTLGKCQIIKERYERTGIFSVAKLVSFELDHRG